MREFNVKVDEAFFNKIVSSKNTIQSIAGMFQNEGQITNEDEINDWLKEVNNLMDKLDRIREEGHSRFELRGE